MIVSASYRTDIPAFYAAWFERRFREGFCMAVNPYGGKPSRISLRQGVDGFVFWTRNAAPFRKALAMVAEAGLPFVIQHTLTNYPRALERNAARFEEIVRLMRALCDDYGSLAQVWRYDPIVFSSLTDADWHLSNFSLLAAALEGVVDEAVVSVAQPYAKTRRNMATLAERYGFSWRTPPLSEQIGLIRELGRIAEKRGMTLTLCAQPILVEAGKAAACIDADRLSRIAKRPIPARRKGNRLGCLCAESRDIGAYNSCPGGCAYCYAADSLDEARKGLARHDPDGAFLIPPNDQASPVCWNP
ncbi:hypothetical protein FACS1894205_0210 [Alphaproteobacteria bacterium]|nr:hypothetical protein FACS1894205_0210 [Alphaproteobacteria bacterium]